MGKSKLLKGFILFMFLVLAKNLVVGCGSRGDSDVGTDTNVGIVSLIAGIQGVKNADKPENANVCIMYGSIVIGFTILGSLLNVIGGKGFSFSSLLIGLVLPGLYLYGAFQNKKLAEGNMIEA
ncbi:MAG: hypothetical protein GX333_10060 [Syntrophomonadaceae bacterium]|nr:hypothetical protein [Syntrophomonadaceae bacterium]